MTNTFNTVNMQCSDSWDFMSEISYGDPDKVTEKANLASNIILQALANETKKPDGFWDNQNVNLLYGLVLYVATSPMYTGERSYQGVLKVLAEEVMESIEDGRGNKIYLFDEKVRRIAPEDYCKEPLMMFVNSSKAAREGVPGGLYVKLARFGARKILSKPEISTISVGRRKTALFLISSDQNSTYDVLITLLTSFLFVNLATLAQKQSDTRLPVTTRFYLDEFPNIGQIPDFQKKIATTRKYGMPMAIAMQGIPQIKAIYPYTWQSLLENCACLLFMGAPPQGEDTLKYVSEMSGETTAIQTTTLYGSSAVPVLASDFTPRTSKGEAKRNVYTKGDLMNMSKEEMVAIIMGEQPARFGKVPAYCLHEWSFCESHLSNYNDHVPAWKAAETGEESGSADEIAAVPDEAYGSVEGGFASVPGEDPAKAAPVGLETLQGRGRHAEGEENDGIAGMSVLYDNANVEDHGHVFEDHET